MRERLEAEGDPEAERKYLYFYPNLEEPEKNYYHDGENYWRVCRFIPESMSMSELTPAPATLVPPSVSSRKSSPSSPRSSW